MAIDLTNTDNLGDDVILELDGVAAVTTAVVGGVTFLFAAGFDDDGMSAFTVGADGSLTSVGNVPDDATLELDGVFSLTTAAIGATTFLFTAGADDDGISVFSIGANGSLTNVDNVTDADAIDLELDGARSVSTAVIGGTTFLFAAGFDDDGVSVFSVGADGSLTNVENATDAADPALELDGAFSVTTAVVGGTTFLFAAGAVDNGVSVFAVGADGSLTNVDNVINDPVVELLGAQSVTTAVVAGTTFLFVASGNDDGVSVFSVVSDGSLTNVENVEESATLPLDGPVTVTTAVVGGTTYLFVVARSDDRVVAFAVGADGSLTHVQTVADNAVLLIDEPIGIATAVVGGKLLVFATGENDDGISVFSVEDGAPVIISNGAGAIGSVSVAENTAFATTVQAADADSSALVYSLAGGADAAKFVVDAITGALSFAAVPDFEAPTDANKDNVYEAVVRASDGDGIVDTQALGVGVTNVAGVTIVGTSGNDKVNASTTVAGKALPTGEEDQILGRAGNDALAGLGGNDRINGGSGNDKLKGGDGADLIVGGLGTDVQFGGLGKDVFDFNSLAGALGDIIKDFAHGQGDRIDLKNIDADTSGSPGDQRFKFIGAGVFTGTDRELRFANGIVQGDTNGDGGANFEIKVLTGGVALVASDFVL